MRPTPRSRPPHTLPSRPRGRRGTLPPPPSLARASTSYKTHPLASRTLCPRAPLPSPPAYLPPVPRCLPPPYVTCEQRRTVLNSTILHPTSYILHPTPYALHHTSYILHHTSYILHEAHGARLDHLRLVDHYAPPAEAKQWREHPAARVLSERRPAQRTACRRRHGRLCPRTVYCAATGSGGGGGGGGGMIELRAENLS